MTDPGATHAWRAKGAEAAGHLQQGRFAQAAELFEQLTALRPDHADSWFNLGYALRHARRYEAALDAYQKALNLGIRRAEEVHLNRAVILSEHLHRTAEAEAELKQAIAVNSGFTSAWLNLGNLREDLGDRALAEDAYEGALRASPGNGRALARIGGLLAQSDPASAVAYLQQAGQAVRQGSEEAAEVAFALGNALDAAGQFPKAFSAISAGNAIAGSLRQSGQRYDRPAHEQLVSDLIASFPARVGRATDDGPPVTFICGMFRSGSTLVEQMLARHSKVTPGGELEFIPALVAEDLQPYPQSASTLDLKQIGQLREKYLDQVAALFPGAGLVTDKRPDNFLHIGLIKTLLPGAKIFHTVRNPTDNLLSAHFLYFGDSITYSDRLDDLVHYYGQYRRLMAHWQALYGEDIIAVNYDDLVAGPRPVMASLLDFLGLDWEDSCLDHGADTSAVRTASVWQVRKPLHRKSSGRWRNYEAEMRPVREALLAAGLIGEVDA